MKEDGLYTLDGRKADGWNDRQKESRRNRSRSNSDEDGYRYNEFDKKADSLRNLEEQKKQKKLDSLDKLQQKIDSAKDKIENSGANEEPAASPLTMLVPVNDQMVGSDS